MLMHSATLVSCTRTLEIFPEATQLFRKLLSALNLFGLESVRHDWVVWKGVCEANVPGI